MSDLFSHAEPDRIGDAASAQRRASGGGAGMQPPEPMTAEVVVPADREKVWQGFTEYIHLWWPAEHTHFGAGTYPELTETGMSEENDSGDRHEWARVVNIDPQREIELSWTMGWEASSPSRVRIRFEDDSAGTAITVVQDGWVSGPDGVRQSKAFEGWSEALTSYAKFMGSDVSGLKR